MKKVGSIQEKVSKMDEKISNKDEKKPATWKENSVKKLKFWGEKKKTEMLKIKTSNEPN